MYPASQSLSPFSDVVAFLSLDLWHHANLSDMVCKFCLGLLNVGSEKQANVGKLPIDELTNPPDFGGNGIRLGTQ